MDAKDNVFINNRFFRTLLKIKRYFGGTPTRRGSKHANSKKIERLEKLVRLQKKADRKRAYASRRIKSKRARGVN